MKTIGSIFPVRLLVINKVHLLIIIMFCFCSCHSIKGQQENNFTKYDSITQRNVYFNIEKMPIYRGGNVAFLNDFGNYFHYDYSQYLDEDIQTKLYVQFVIDTEGHLIGARIYNKGTDNLTPFEKAGLKALNLMQDWQSGEYNGKLVNVLLTRMIHIDYRQ
ncbi:MAG: hypothetical protein LBO74_03700 [Candidatus Symbiothrix sp.]|jgi:hypothetical protein|nr:hypothetical protein [Candidatus Symbiothrix sp.]